MDALDSYSDEDLQLILLFFSERLGRLQKIQARYSQAWTDLVTRRIEISSEIARRRINVEMDLAHPRPAGLES